MLKETSLTHWGVLGMKWGVRKEELPGVSHKTYREAKKDAEEHTRARMFFGEGAGTRRKLINAKVNAKSNRDPAYKQAFDHHVAQTDFAQRAEQAKGERKRKDVVAGTAKTARGVKTRLLGQGAPTLTAIAIAGGLVYAFNPAARSTVNRVAKMSYSKVKDVGFSAYTKARTSSKFKSAFGKVFTDI